MGQVPLDVKAIQAAIRRTYAEASRSAEGKFNYPTGRAGLRLLGYDLSVVAGLPDEVLNTFCGVGNPFSLGPIQAGEAVLDVGCGAGLDLVFAARLVGPAGQVHGLDLTSEMVERARQTLHLAGVPGARVQLGAAEALPYSKGTFDVVISNGVLNLSPLKEACLREIARVLKAGGRLQMADIVRRADLPAEVAANLQAWSA